MQYIEAIKYEKAKYKSVFLAGGISNCADWQNEITKALSDLEITIFNPRRKNFDTTIQEETKKQILWEYEMLRKADYIIFRFTPETLNPITLFELGAALERNQKLFISIHPEYKRKADVEIQTKLRRPEIEITSTIGDLATQFKTFIKQIITTK